MTTQTDATTTTAETDPGAGAPDGRRQRSEASRTRIVQAMIALVSEGHTLPSAEAVATRAGVGLRTVFRLFKDMDSLYRGMQSELTDRIGTLIEAPLAGATWRERLDCLIERRSRAFEAILPLQIAADAQRHRSPALQEGRARLVRIQREALLGLLPPAVRADATLLEALDLALSFEAWRRLRTDQGQGPVAALGVMRRMAALLAAGAGP